VQQKRADREQSMVAKIKCYGQAVQYALRKMPFKAGELPPWFDLVENIYKTYDVPVELKATLILPYLTPRSKSLISRLPVADQESYPKLKEFILKQHQLGAREYRARFAHATRNPGETWQSYCSRLHNLFRYYRNSRQCDTYNGLFDLCVCDKLQDLLPPSNLKHCLAAAKDCNLISEQLASMADDYESNFFADGQYEGLSVTAGKAKTHFDKPRGGYSGGGQTLTVGGSVQHAYRPKVGDRHVDSAS